MREKASIREALEEIREMKACLFDMDGLIFDTERSFMEQLSVVMGEEGYHLTREIYCSTLGLSGEELRDKMRGYYGREYPFREMSRRARERLNRVAESVGLAVKPEIPGILEYLHERKVPCAVASGSRSDLVRKYLGINGLDRYFQAVVGGEQVSRSKPAPDIFLLAAEEIGTAPEHCVVLEDSENGIRAGRAAGCVTLCVPDMKMPREEFSQDIDYLVVREELFFSRTDFND